MPIDVTKELLAALSNPSGGFDLPRGEAVFTQPVHVGPHQQLVGISRSSSVLRWKPPPGVTNDYPITFGSPRTYQPRAELSRFTLVGGGIRVSRHSNFVDISDLWIYDAPAVGLLIDGPGDRTVFENIVALRCLTGIHALSRGANHGLRFVACSAQECETGIHLEAVAGGNGVVYELDHCTAQGNRKEQLRLTGYVTNCVLRHFYAEPQPGRRDVPNIVCAEALIAGQASGWRPKFLRIEGGSELNGAEVAIDATGLEVLVLGQLHVGGGGGAIRRRPGLNLIQREPEYTRNIRQESVAAPADAAAG